MDVQTISRNTDGVPISLNLACKILHRGKIKTKKALIHDMVCKNGIWGYNLYKVLNLVGKNI